MRCLALMTCAMMISMPLLSMDVSIKGQNAVPPMDTVPIITLEGYGDLNSMVFSVNESGVYEYISHLQNFESRHISHFNNSRSTDFIYKNMERVGLDTQLDDFTYITYDLANVVATLNGSDPSNDEVFIVCSHHDSYSTVFAQAPGADDNGSGTAAVMLLAQIMAQYRWNATIKFITFNAEEQGMVGSGHYVDEAVLAGDTITGVLNLDMIAYNGNDNDLALVYTSGGIYGLDTEWLADEMMEANVEYGLGINMNKFNDDDQGSDHKPFWQNGYDAILAIEEHGIDYPFYHTPLDTVDKLNMTYATAVTRATLGALANLAGINSTDIREPSHSYEVPSVNGLSNVQLINVSLDLTDPSGVDVSTIGLFINGTAVPFSMEPITFGYRLYTGDMFFDDASANYVRITAEDIYGNLLDYTWNFTVESVPPGSVRDLSIDTSASSVLISWSPSASPDVDHYEIFVATKPNTFNFATPTSVTTGTTYLHSSAAGSLGVRFYCIRAVDGAGNYDENYSILGKSTISTYDGWNMLGNPFILSDSEPMVALDYMYSFWDMAMTYDHGWTVCDRTAPEWIWGYRSIEPGEGFWLNVQGDFKKLCITGEVTQHVRYNLTKGWNLISYPGFSPATVDDTFVGVPFDMIQAFNPTMEPNRVYDLTGTDYMMIGGGYWIHLTEDFVWDYSVF